MKLLLIAALCSSCEPTEHSLRYSDGTTVKVDYCSTSGYGIVYKLAGIEVSTLRTDVECLRK